MCSVKIENRQRHGNDDGGVGSALKRPSSLSAPCSRPREPSSQHLFSSLPAGLVYCSAMHGIASFVVALIAYATVADAHARVTSPPIRTVRVLTALGARAQLMPGNAAWSEPFAEVRTGVVSASEPRPNGPHRGAAACQPGMRADGVPRNGTSIRTNIELSG